MRYAGLVMLACVCAALVCGAEDRTVAFVGRRVILESDIKRAMAEGRLSSADAFAVCVRDRLLAQAAQDAGVQVSAEEVDGAVESAMRRYPDRPAFLAALKQAGASLEMFRERTRESLMVRKYLADTVERTITVSPAEMMRVYAQVRSEIPVEVFLLRKEFASEAEARRAAEEWKPGVEDGFDTVGWMNLNQIVESVRSAVSPLRPGQITQPVFVTTHWYLFIVKDRRESPVPEEVVASAARQRVFLIKYETKLQALLKDLATRYPVVECSPSS